MKHGSPPSVSLDNISQTNLQLYNEILSAGYPQTDLELVRRAYDLATRLYSGCFEANGKAFTAHVVGVASIVARLQLPPEMVAAACIHNVYVNADFGDGRRHSATPYRRRLVRQAVGRDVEETVYRFSQRRLHRHLEEILSGAESLSTRDRYLVVLDLADILEKYSYLGVLYSGEVSWFTGFTERHGEALIALAGRVGYAELGAALQREFQTAASTKVPQVLRSDPKWKCLMQIPPRSYRRRPKVWMLRKAFRLAARFKTMNWNLYPRRGKGAASPL